MAPTRPVASIGWSSADVAAWERRGEHRTLAGWDVFTLDVPAARVEVREPLLVLHGFPTSSFDFHRVVDTLAADRRVLLLDLVGFGLSAKPDISYGFDLYADVVQAFVADAGVTRLAMVTHDIGDTVGGELLARQLEGRWPVEVTHRTLANGSIYVDMAQLSDAQQLLLSLPDQRLADEHLPGTSSPLGESFRAGLAATFSGQSVVAASELDAAWELAAHDGGHLLLPRTIRYVEERRSRERRFTGAIEAHPSPLSIVWGVDDPIAVVAMAHRLREAVPSASMILIDAVGHYPMLEAPALFLDAVASAQR
ncbi:MAG TPA: alpha/beta hydrolase [Acidimicrobiales bacterium]|nr:alpha/beta hydrolase [Acidimicrobiales bacterium]